MTAIKTTGRKPWHGPKDRWEWVGIVEQFSWPTKPKWQPNGGGYYFPDDWEVLSPASKRQHKKLAKASTLKERAGSLRRILPAPKRKGGG